MFTSTISCLSWSNLSTTYWPGPALWYGSIILALISIILGAQQAMFMPDTVDAEAAQEFRRCHMANNGSEKRPEPRQIMLFVWQAPLMCLSYSIVFFLAGLCLLDSGNLSGCWSICYFNVRGYLFQRAFAVVGPHRRCRTRNQIFQAKGSLTILG